MVSKNGSLFHSWENITLFCLDWKWLEKSNNKLFTQSSIFLGRFFDKTKFLLVYHRAHAQKISSREAECVLAHTELPVDDIRFDVTITHIERPDCLFIQRVPPTDEDEGFSDDPDPTLESASEELQALEEIMAKINEPEFFKKYPPLTTATEGE